MPRFLWTMDERHLLSAARYVELNPVRARLVKSPEEYPWSSAAAHMSGMDDGLVKVAPLLELAGDWGEFLDADVTERQAEELRSHERTGRPLGNERFIEKLEKLLSRALCRRKPGPKPKRRAN